MVWKMDEKFHNMLLKCKLTFTNNVPNKCDLSFFHLALREHQTMLENKLIEFLQMFPVKLKIFEIDKYVINVN